MAACVDRAAGPELRAIVGGSATGTPPDSPEARLDPLTADSPVNFVGALAMFAGGQEFRGSAVALSRHWVLTAGHNLDMNADGQVEEGLRIDLHLPGFGAYAVTSFHLNPLFTGFLNPGITHDLALLYVEDALPAGLNFPSLKFDLEIDDRNGHMFSATAAINVGMKMGQDDWLRPELRLGWRQNVSVDPGETGSAPSPRQTPVS